MIRFITNALTAIVLMVIITDLVTRGMFGMRIDC